MKTLSVSEFKATCLAVLKEVSAQKKRVVITKRGKPIAEIIPVDDTEDTVPLKDTVLFMGDVVSPVSDDEWEVLG